MEKETMVPAISMAILPGKITILIIKSMDNTSNMEMILIKSMENISNMEMILIKLRSQLNPSQILKFPLLMM
jgi:hypothetical protein